MNERNQVPILLVRLDNLIRAIATFSGELAESRNVQEQILSRLENIERNLAVPAVYTLRQAVKRLGYGMDWGYRHLADLVTPLSRDPLRFSIQEIEALAASQAKRGRSGHEERQAG